MPSPTVLKFVATLLQITHLIRLITEQTEGYNVDYAGIVGALQLMTEEHLSLSRLPSNSDPASVENVMLLFEV
jgi:hypothetical protein